MNTLNEKPSDLIFGATGGIGSALVRRLASAASRMMRSGGGSIVLMSSAVTRRGMINHEAIAAAKAGVAGLAQSAAATYARYNIRLNCVAPGLTRTPLTEPITKNEASLKRCTRSAASVNRTKSPAPSPGCLTPNKNESLARSSVWMAAWLPFRRAPCRERPGPEKLTTNEANKRKTYAAQI